MPLAPSRAKCRSKHSPGGLWSLPATAVTPRAQIQSMTLRQPQPGTYLSSSLLLGTWQEPASKHKRTPQPERHLFLHKDESKAYFLKTPSGGGFQHSLQRCSQCAKSQRYWHACKAHYYLKSTAVSLHPMQASHSQAASPTAPGHTTRGQQRDMQCPRSFASYCATPNSSDLFNILYFYWLPISP